MPRSKPQGGGPSPVQQVNAEGIPTTGTKAKRPPFLDKEFNPDPYVFDGHWISFGAEQARKDLMADIIEADNTEVFTSNSAKFSPGFRQEVWKRIFRRSIALAVLTQCSDDFHGSCMTGFTKEEPPEWEPVQPTVVKPVAADA